MYHKAVASSSYSLLYLFLFFHKYVVCEDSKIALENYIIIKIIIIKITVICWKLFNFNFVKRRF